MAPLLFALALMAQDADAPVPTAAPQKSTVAPLPIQGGPVSAPTDDYGYVAWCYGALAGYVDLYDVAMPEVIRIERAWPTPSTEENIKEIYPAQREEAKRNLMLFREALQAAEKASPTPIQAQGTVAISRGRAIWTGSGSVPKAQLAQFWMSWSPPARCEETAKALKTKATLFGQALVYNTKPGPAAPPPPPVESPVAGLPIPAETLAEAPLEVGDGQAAPLVVSSRVTPETQPLPGTTMITEPPFVSGEAPEAAAMAVTEPSPAPTGEAPAEPPVDVAAMSVGAPAPEETAAASSAGSAIDSLLPSGDEPAGEGEVVVSETTTGAEDTSADPGDDVVVNTQLDGVVTGSDGAEAQPEPAPEPVAAPPPPAPKAAAPAPAKPKPARKKGLRETLGGLRGRQE